MKTETLVVLGIVLVMVAFTPVAYSYYIAYISESGQQCSGLHYSNLEQMKFSCDRLEYCIDAGYRYENIYLAKCVGNEQ